MSAAAYLFAGAAMYFDEDGRQVADLQDDGLCGLHEFVKRYPGAPVYWGWWRKWSEELSPKAIQYLLRHLRKHRSKKP